MGPGRIVGIGGIGRGIFFQSLTDETLGRNESRLADRLNIRDYCKLQIVFHYIAQFVPREIPVIPVGYVGNDPEGQELLREMERAGLELSQVRVHDTLPTMLSVCLQYPDKSGCNLTSANSACGALSPDFAAAVPDLCGIREGDFVVALPEVPLESRFALLQAGKRRGAFCAASFAASEAARGREERILEFCDLVALNQEETAAAAGAARVDSLEEAEQCARTLLNEYPHLKLWLTVGAKGSVSADQTWIRSYTAFPISVENTGGAGDATLGGILAGLACGLPFQSRKGTCRWERGAHLESAAEFGAILGELSVSSPDSIDWRLTPEYVTTFLQTRHWTHQFPTLSTK